MLLVANARASGLDGTSGVLSGAREHLRSRGAAVEIRLTGDVDELAAAVHAAEGRRVVLLGGDGSVHAAANLDGTAPELALLPAGLANNIAHSLGVPLDLAAAAELAVEGSAASLDVIAADNGRRRMRAVEGVSVGFHAQARAGYSAPNSADMVAGIRAGLHAARRFRPIAVSLQSDGASQVLTVAQLFVANMPLFAFSLRVAPMARASDGLLDLVAIEATHRAALAPMLIRLRHGTHLQHRNARAWTARRIHLDPGGSSPVICDTTDLGTDPVELAVERGGLRLVVPGA